jgi:hypothetical protein
MAPGYGANRRKEEEKMILSGSDVSNLRADNGGGFGANGGRDDIFGVDDAISRHGV